MPRLSLSGQRKQQNKKGYKKEVGFLLEGADALPLSFDIRTCISEAFTLTTC